ncbi:prolyl oligopeptidase family protein [soil metagenome]
MQRACTVKPTHRLPSVLVLASLVIALLVLAPPAARAESPPTDVWLEDSASQATKDWIAARSAESDARLLQDPRYERERQRFVALAGSSHSEDYLNGGVVNRVKADAHHPLGRWQVRAASPAARAILGEKRAGDNSVGEGWQTMLDLDELAKREGVRWTIPTWWQNPMCDTSIGTRCMLALSPDGGDRTVLREFDLKTRSFVEGGPRGGFRIDTPARTYANWIDADHLLLASDFGPGSLSDAGYARQARLWQRGTPHTEAKLLFEAPADAVLYIPHNFRNKGSTLFIAEVWHKSAGAPSWWVLHTDRAPERFEPPVELVRYRGLTGIVDGRLIAMTAQPLRRGKVTWPAGSLLALPLPGARGAIEPVFVPRANEAVDAVFHLAVASDALWFGVMHDVSGQLFRAQRDARGRWQRTPQPVPPHGAVRLLTGEVAPSAALVKTESLLSPPQTTLRFGVRVEALEQAEPAFDAARYFTEQRFALSRDGTRIPYYVTRARGQPADGKAAALLTAYGGFGVSSLPTYLSTEFNSDLLMPMLQNGGIFVHVNVRGGGEYGPAWHRAAQGRHHARSIEDLIAVAEDLGRARLADPKRLGFIGASNGGLLAAATAVRRPDLFRAVIANVPLTDMLRFHELFTGAVWIAEYGDPRQPEDRAALAAYSPLHQLREGVAYPELLVTTSSSDDRVHPGHARRFAERLRALGQPVLFHESTDTGHGAAAALDAAARLRAFESTYLLQALGLGEPKP